MKKILSVFLCLFLLFSVMPLTAGAYNDVSGSYEWAQGAIDQMVAKNVMTPKSETEFGVNDPVTRAEFAKILAVAFDIPTANPAAPTFADVAPGNWAYPYVETMYKMLLLDGSEYFQPQNKITREEMVSGVVMALGNDQNEITSIEAIYHTFRDAHLISPVYLKNIQIASQDGTVSGYEDHTFRPQNLVTRAELAVLLGKVGVSAPEEVVKVERGPRKMDMIMLYDIDHGSRINARPDHGWWPLNPEYPDDPAPDFNSICRVTTPLMGTYDCTDPKLQKQHLYWISALGCNAIQTDFTNVRSVREPGNDGSKGFFKGVYNAFETQLKVISETTEFEAPKAYGMMRMNNEEYDNLQLMLDDIYDIYEKYPDAWYKFKDGSENEDKPFLVIFCNWDLLSRYADTGFPFKDDRFNIRWGNGFYSNVAKTSTIDEKGYKAVKPGNWLFVENEAMPGKEGYYRPFYTVSAVDGKPEQMVTWASIWQGGRDWDGMLDEVDGKTTIQRYTEPVYDIMPKALLVNRWNYPLAWPAESQEGLSRNDSTHIEPNVDWGFKVFDMVTKEMYKLNGWAEAAPPRPVVTSFDQQKGNLALDLNGYPLEYKISTQKSLADAEWTFLNVGAGGMKLPEDVTETTVVYIQTRNTFGESPVGSYRVVIDPNLVGGEEEGVKIIKTVDELRAMEEDPEGEYKLGATIDLSGEDWTPIYGFKGTFDGNSKAGYSIKNLTMSAGNGLFDMLEGATIKNLVVENADINAAGPIAGVITGRLLNGTMENCAALNSKVTGVNFVGGLMGTNDHSTINSCVFTGSVNGDATVGGICGYSEFGQTTNCLVNAEISGNSFVGGIVGTIAGELAQADKGVDHCIALGKVIGGTGTAFGGIVGQPFMDSARSWKGIIQNNFALQTEISGTLAGRITSEKTEAVLGNYALDTLTASKDDKGEDNLAGADITADQAKDMATYEAVGFKTSVWTMGSGHPVLKWLSADYQN